jgi:hypothetical protein
VQRQRERLTVARCSVGPAAAIQAAATCTRDYATSIHRIDYECVNDSQVAPCHSGTTDVESQLLQHLRRRSFGSPSADDGRNGDHGRSVIDFRQSTRRREPDTRLSRFQWLACASKTFVTWESHGWHLPSERTSAPSAQSRVLRSAYRCAMRSMTTCVT